MNRRDWVKGMGLIFVPKYADAFRWKSRAPEYATATLGLGGASLYLRAVVGPACVEIQRSAGFDGPWTTCHRSANAGWSPRTQPLMVVYGADPVNPIAPDYSIGMNHLGVTFQTWRTRATP